MRVHKIERPGGVHDMIDGVVLTVVVNPRLDAISIHTFQWVIPIIADVPDAR